MAYRQAGLVLRGREQGLVTGNAFFAVDGVGHRVGLRHFVGGVHGQGLVFVAQVQVFLQGALVGLRRLHIPARALVQLDVPPPLFDRVDAAAIEQVIEPRQRRCSGRQLHGDLPPQAVGQQAFQVPGAGFHAAAAHTACGIGDAVAGAFFGVAFPDFVAVVHQLGACGDGPRRALAGALVAAFAKALQAKVDGPVRGHGHVGGHAAAFQARAQKRVEDHLANAADLAQARQQKQRRLQHVAVQHRMHPGRITQTPNLLGQDAAHQRKAQISPHALRHRNPVVAAGAFHGFVALVDQQVQRVGVVGGHGVAARVVRVIGPLGHSTQAHRVHPQIVRSGFQLVGVALGVERAGGHRATRRAKLQEQQSAQSPTRTGPDGAFHHVVRILGVVLHRLAQIAKQGPRKKVGTLRESRHPVVVNEGGGRVLALERFKRVRPLAKLAPGISIAVERAFEGALAQPPGRAVALPAVLLRVQGLIRGQRQSGADSGQGVALAHIGVAAIGQRQACGQGQTGQVHIAATGAVGAGLVAQHAQITRQQHGGLRRQHSGAGLLCARQPVAAGLTRFGVSRKLHQDHDGVAVVRYRPMHRAGRLQHIGQDHVHAGRKTGGLALGQLFAQGRHSGVADRFGQPSTGRQGADAHHRRIKVITCGLQVPGAFIGLCRDLTHLRVHSPIAHQIEHGHVTRHGVGQRFGVVVFKTQCLHGRQGAFVGRMGCAAQALQRVGAQVYGAVAVREQAHAQSPFNFRPADPEPSPPLAAPQPCRKARPARRSGSGLAPAVWRPAAGLRHSRS